MLCGRRFAIVAALVGWLFITTTGCATMGQKQPLKKDGPQTVGEWIKQKLVEP